MKHPGQIAILIIAGIGVTACGRSQPESAAEPASETAPAVAEMADLETLLANASRAAEDRARDAGRKPAEVIAYLGIAAGMSVIDIIAAGGYYTEVLSLAVGAEGHVVAQNTDFILQMRDGVNEKALSARLADNRLPNVTRLDKNFEDISTADGQFDAAITALNFHDVYNNGGADRAVGFLQTIGSLLKPGAVFGIIDHVGVAGADNATLHRAELATVIETAEAAGFIVEGHSDLLANDSDDHTQGVFAEGVRGHTDRFLVKLRKPAS